MPDEGCRVFGTRRDVFVDGEATTPLPRFDADAYPGLDVEDAAYKWASELAPLFGLSIGELSWAARMAHEHFLKTGDDRVFETKAHATEADAWVSR